jgi:hypothetical protein
LFLFLRFHPFSLELSKIKIDYLKEPLKYGQALKL